MNIVRSLENGRFSSDVTVKPPRWLPSLNAGQFRAGGVGSLAPFLRLLPAPPFEPPPASLLLPSLALAPGQLSETIAFAALAGGAAAGVILAFA